MTRKSTNSPKHSRALAEHKRQLEKLVGASRRVPKPKTNWRDQYVAGLREGITPLSETGEGFGQTVAKPLPVTYDDPEMQRREDAARKLADTRALAIKRMYVRPELSHSPSELDTEGDRSIDQF